MDYAAVVVVEDVAARPEIARFDGVLALEHVANRPIIDHVLDSLEAAGVQDVVVAACSEHAEAIREALNASEQRSAVRLRYVEQPGPVDLAAALRLAGPVIGSAPCIVHLANGLLSEPLTPLLGALRADAPDVVLLVHQEPAPDTHLNAATQEMLHIAELNPRVAGLGVAGVWLFGPGALARVAGMAWDGGRELDLTRIAEPIGAVDGTVRVLGVEAWCRYKGDPLDLLELNRTTLDTLEVERARRVSNGNHTEGRVLIDDRASVRASTIIGPAIIGPDARIDDAYIGPYTSIGAGARIEGAEIERSIICAGASIMHVGGRIVASVVGRDARVFRDFSLPQALRLRVGAGTQVALY